MNTEQTPIPAAAPAPAELAEIDHRLGLDAPQRAGVPHTGEGLASILRRLQWA